MGGFFPLPTIYTSSNIKTYKGIGNWDLYPLSISSDVNDLIVKFNGS